MEDATSIFQLRETQSQYASERKAPIDVVSYSDVLKNLKSEEIQQQQQQCHSIAAGTQQQTASPPPQQQQQVFEQTAEHPFVAFRGVAPSSPPVTATATTASETPVVMNNAFQNEMIILLMVYVFVHMSHVQTWLRTKVPNIVDTSGSTSLLGLLMNGVAVILIWNVSKKMIIRYMNDL